MRINLEFIKTAFCILAAANRKCNTQSPHSIAADTTCHMPHATCHMPRVVVVRLSRRRRMCVKHIKIILFFFSHDKMRWQLPHTLPVETPSPPTPPPSPPLPLCCPSFAATFSCCKFSYFCCRQLANGHETRLSTVAATGWHQIGPHSF